MNTLKQIVIIIISIMIATSYSAIVTILMNRKDKRDEGKILYLIIYMAGMHALFIYFLIFLLLWIIVLF